MTKTQQIVAIACGVFRPELTALKEQGLFDFTIRYLPSNLHMVPIELYKKMKVLLEREQQQGNKVLLIYGDCHPHMHEQAASPGVARVKGANCCDILLGRDQYMKMIKDNVFFLFPEWTARWKTILGTLMDLDEETTKELMQERNSKLVYLDTGVCPVLDKELKACSSYFGLPYEVMNVSLEHFLSVIRDATIELEGKDR